MLGNAIRFGFVDISPAQTHREKQNSPGSWMRLAFLFTYADMLPSQQEGGISVNEDDGRFAWSRHTENSARLNSHTVVQGVHYTSKACLGSSLGGSLAKAALLEKIKPSRRWACPCCGRGSTLGSLRLRNVLFCNWYDVDFFKSFGHLSSGVTGTHVMV